MRDLNKGALKLALFGLVVAAPVALAQTTDYVADNVFTQGIEGPAVDTKGNLYAVSIGQDGTIGIIDKKDNAQLFVKLPQGSTGNGIRFDRKGFMYVADYSGHNVLKIDTATKAVSVYAHSDKMNQPNDIAIAKSGVIYASDP